MSEKIRVLCTKNHILPKAGGAQAHYTAGGDYVVTTEVARALVEAGAGEDIDNVFGLGGVAETEPPTFTRPPALEPEDTGDLDAEEF